MLDPLVDILLFNLYGALVTGIGLLLAIPYAIWQGVRWIEAHARRRST
ncbi:MAG: hypothetical protein R3B97_17395 [Dehalococcoidia bacterium]|nr:hypothetical protein [Dehalococcoidia bacterium]MCB9485916.1 hypothetical protein [Thermoflexaceae bacterium]